MPEKQTVEYKQNWQDDYLKQICGFANAQGGVLSIGRDDAGRVVGVKDAEQLLVDLPNKIRNALGVTAEVNLLRKSGKNVLEISVPKYTVPISLRGRYYFRSGSVNQELTGGALNEFLLKKSGRSWDDVIEEEATFADIDEIAVRDFLRMSEKAGRLPERGDSMPTEELFEKLRIAKNGRLTRAAIVFFGKDPGKFYRGLHVQIGRFGRNDGDILYQEREEGNIVQLVDAVLKQLHRKFFVRRISYEGVFRVETPPYPTAAMREVLLNALIHRSYMGPAVQIRVRDSSISFWNYGGLPDGITLDELARTHASHPRNQLLADVAFLGNYIDAWGSGIKKITDACKTAGIQPPTMMENNGGFLVTFQAPFKHQTTIEEEPQNNPDPISHDISDPISHPISYPISHDISNAQFSLQVGALLKVLLEGEQNGRGLMKKLLLKEYKNFKYSYLEPAFIGGFIEMTKPDAPRSPSQKYRLTAKGFAVVRYGNTTQAIDQVKEKSDQATDYVTPQVTTQVTTQVRTQVTTQVTAQVTTQVKKILMTLKNKEFGKLALMKNLVIKSDNYFKNTFLLPALESGLIEMTQPDSPRSPTQKYRLTAKGFAVLKNK